MSPTKATTSVNAPMPGREADQKKNNTGGFTFTLDQWGVLDRFLMLGTESGGYYVTKKDKTKLAFTTVKSCIAENGMRVVARALEYSLAGRAPKNDPSVVAIALCAVYGDPLTVAAAYDALPKIARTGTWLFLFVSILDSLGKWNAAAKRGVSKWYTTKTVDRLAVQLLKYQQRDGWAHRDVLRLAHVKPSSEVQSNLFRWSVKGSEGLTLGTAVPQILIDFELLKRTDKKADVLRIIESNSDLTWEMVPTQWLKDKDILSALVKNMGLTAVIRKLGALTAHGVIAPLSAGAKDVIAKLGDAEQLKKQRVHPITLLNAFKQYQAGHGLKGDLTWRADQRVLDAIDDAFYASFGTIEKTDENYFLGVDCSGSMQGARVNGLENLTAIEVAGVMALAIVKNQPNYWIGGFNTKMGELKITPKMRLNAVTKTMLAFRWGSTNASLTFSTAQAMGMDVDKFVTITDNEVNCGVHPAQALRNYRQKSGKHSASIIIGTEVSEFTIADPKDPRQLDIAGFDSAAPQLIAQM
jgi:60 kDa SS-A/Ro ribonucleoprotein